MLYFSLRLSVLFIFVQFSISLKYGYYFTGTFNQTTQQPFSISEIIHNMSEVSRDFNIEFRGSILNLRNENKTGDMYFIIYSKENSIGGIYKNWVDMSYQLKQIEFYNININFAYFAMMDVELSSASINTQYLSWKLSDYKNILLQLYQSGTAGFNFQFFDPPIPTFNKFFVSFTNSTGIIKAKMLSTMFSSNNYSCSDKYQIYYPVILGNLNATINKVFWDKISIFSSEGTIKYEYYITGTFEVSFLTFLQSKNIINLSYQIFQNISFSFSSFGVLFEGEILLINNSTNTIDFHGSLFRENKDLREINYIYTHLIPAIENVVLKNVKIYNIFQATIYAYLNNLIYNSSNFLQNISAFKDDLKGKILSGLLKENLILLNGNYYEFVLQIQPVEDRIGIFSFFLVVSDQTNLFEIEMQILNVFKSLSATSDPFNTKIERLQRQTIENYTKYNVPDSIFNVSSSLFLPVTSAYVKNNLSLTTNVNTESKTFTPVASTTPDSTMPSMHSTIESQTNSKTQSIISNMKESTTNIENLQFTPSTSSYMDNIVKPMTRSLISTTPSTNSTVSSTIIKSTSYITPSKAPSTQLTTSTTTTNIPVGGTIANVDIKCTFQEDFVPAYNDTNSEEYKIFTDKKTTELKESFSKNQNLKLLSVTYKSIRSGSVVVDFTFSTSSDTFVTSSQLESSILNSTKSAFGNATVDKIAVTSLIYGPIPFTTNTYQYSTTQPDSWKVALGLTLGIIGTLIIVLVILHVFGYLRKIAHKLKGYIQKSSQYI